VLWLFADHNHAPAFLPVLAREEHDADGAVPVEKGEQLGSALAVRSVERAEVVRDEAAGGLGVMCWS